MRALLGAEKQGVVVLVASTAGIRANYLACLYSSSKHAVVGFAKSMGQADIEEGVRVNCMLPGTVSSPMWHNRQDDYKDWAKFDDRKHILPSDIAAVMLKMVESKEYEGGTCVMKTPFEEKIIEEGYQKSLAKLKEYDPYVNLASSTRLIRLILRCYSSPRPDAFIDRRVKDVLAKERGRKWT